MSPRLPLVVVLGMLAGAAVASPDAGTRPLLVPGPEPVAGQSAPAARPDEAVGSTWYCAAGRIDEPATRPDGTEATEGSGGAEAADAAVADHIVVVTNPTAAAVSGLLTVYGGEIAAPGQEGQEAEEGKEGEGDPGLPRRRRPVDPSPTTDMAFTVGAYDSAEMRLGDVTTAPLAAALVELDGGGAVVEHAVDRPDAGAAGRSVAPCASAAASSWHFAWGATTRDAASVLVLFNPFASPVRVDATFSTDAGVREPLRWQGLTVPARSVVGVEVGEDVSRREVVSASVQARGGRLVVERWQSFDGQLGRGGASLALGQPDPAERWLLPHGRTDDHTAEQVVLYNPGEQPAEVEVGVRPSGPEQPPLEPFIVVVRPGRHRIIDYTREERVPAGVDHSTWIRSRNGVPVVVERVLSFEAEAQAESGDSERDPPTRSHHGGPGGLFVARTWTFAAPAIPADRVSFVVVNPDADRATTVSLTTYGGGAHQAPEALQNVELAAGGRSELELPPEAVLSNVVLRSAHPVVAERVLVEGGVPVAVTPGLPTTDDATPIASP